MLNKEFLGSVMIMHDITRQAELERMKNEFISNVSHELRTPITSIKSYVDTLCNHGEKLDPDIYREFLQIIDNEADRLMYLVNDVLELSRVEEANRELEMNPPRCSYSMRTRYAFTQSHGPRRTNRIRSKLRRGAASGSSK